MSDEAVLCWCDPEKNKECRKMSCRHVLTLPEGGVCEATFNPAFALLDEHGKPMVYEKQKEWQRKKAAALAALKEREERKNVSGVNQQPDVYARRRVGRRTATCGTSRTGRTA